MTTLTRILLFILSFFLLSTQLFYLTIADAQDKTQESNSLLAIPLLDLPTFSVIEKSEIIQLETEKNEWTLKHTPVFPNSEEITITTGKLLVRDKDYQIEYATGLIRFEEAILNQEISTISITYRAIPFILLKTYKRELFGTPLKQVPEETKRKEGPIDGTGQRPTLPTTSTTPSSSQLEYSGSRTFGISVGSGRALSQNQEFRINVRGNVSDNIEVLAMLSDQDLPIQPEGMTEDIQDINQKLIRIMHPRVVGTLGDFDASLGTSEFIFFPRALEGVKVEGDFENVKFHFIPSALPKGQSTSKVIQGEEGRSEYRLDVNNQFVIVKAGSEIVWLNGEKMRRGENNDYIIREYGDPIIEFNNKHLITSHDIIRVDFQYIPEDRTYQQNIYGINNVFVLPGEWLSIGTSYAVEADIDDPDQALVLFDDKSMEALRQNRLESEGDGTLLTPPQKHTVWGLESRLNMGEKTWVNGELALSAIDKNTYSHVDRKKTSQAWKLIGYTGWDIPTGIEKLRPKLIANMDVRALDADFLPVGASSSNRNRHRYSTQYATESFEDAILLTPNSMTSSSDERTINLDIKVLPYPWLQFNGGGGRTLETAIGVQKTQRTNINWGASFSPWTRSSNLFGTTSLRENILSPSSQYQLDNIQNPPLKTLTGTATENNNGKAPKHFQTTQQTSLLKKLPNLRWNDYRSMSVLTLSDEAKNINRTNSINLQENYQKSRQEGSISYYLSPFEFVGTFNRFNATDDFSAARNRRRNRSSGRINLVNFKWVSVQSNYELEQAYAKEPLLTVDDESLGISDWMRSTTARTWKVGLFSQQRQWVNIRTNISRRIVKAHSELGTDSTTQLADMNIQLTPFSRALDAEVTYQLDKKLTTQRREIYTDLHPLTGHRIQPGEGYYIRLDDLRYVEDPEEGTFIKIYQNVGDKPTTAVDATFQLRIQPRQFFARRRRNQQSVIYNGNATRLGSRDPGISATRSAKPSTNQQIEAERTPSPLTRFLSALNVHTRLWITEEQQAEEALSLYLLRSLQETRTLFGRINQRHRIEFSPSPQFSFEVNRHSGRSLNKRINTQERHRNHRTWEVGFSVNPTLKLSVGANWEQRRETESYSQLNIADVETVSDQEDTALPPTPISNLHQFEQSAELNCQYELSRAFRWRGIAGYNRTLDTEQLSDEDDAKTRTFSLTNSITYSIIGKGRVETNHKLGYGRNDGGVPFAQYYFYQGISHEVRATADYRLRKFTDLLFRLNYRLLSTEQRKPEHRLEMTVSAEL